MKHSIFILLILISPIFVNAQMQTHDFGTCFSKANQKSITNKMESILNRVSRETACPKDKITYTVDEYYTGFYSKNCRHLPKKITFNANGVLKTYKHEGLSGSMLNWLWGSWKLV